MSSREGKPDIALFFPFTWDYLIMWNSLAYISNFQVIYQKTATNARDWISVVYPSLFGESLDLSIWFQGSF